MSLPRNNALLELIAARTAWKPGNPLRLHLGCGENHLDGYVNIDYPPSRHTAQKTSVADLYGDLTSLDFPDGVVDEIRLHHVFEHFDRVVALGLLIRWHEWLRLGGMLVIETPDILGCARTLVTTKSYKTRQATIRHAFGSHEADWAHHLDGWYDEKFEKVLKPMGFHVQFEKWQSSQEPFIANVAAMAVKQATMPRSELLDVADLILADSVIGSGLPTEEKIYQVWRQSLREFLDGSGIPPGTEEMRPVTAVIFSKNRAMQLDATLRSFQLHCRDCRQVAIKVLYTTDRPELARQYEVLRREYAGVEFVAETDFRQDVLRLAAPTKYLLFLVDDNIFVGDFLVGEAVSALEANPDAIGFSLRLGKNSTYSYAFSTGQQVPSLSSADGSVAKFSWVKGEFEFGFPLEVSSSIYRTADLLPVMESAPFTNPNYLEQQLSRARSGFTISRPNLLCYPISVTFCNPVNMVQAVHQNPAGADDRFSADSLAERFDEGYRIDVAPFAGFVPRACHQEAELALYRNQEQTGRESGPVAAEGARTVEALNGAISFNPYLIEAHMGLADAYLDAGRADAAVATYRRILSFAPDHGETREKLVALIERCRGIRGTSRL